MAEKRRYTVSLPDHVADAVEKHAKPLSATPTEYAGDIIRWWFGQGCPPVTHDEEALRKRAKLNVWQLNPKDSYSINDDKIVAEILLQLGIPNLWAPIQEHDKAHALVPFDNHPTHWLVFHIWKGQKHAVDNGMLFEAYPKKSVSREMMLSQIKETAEETQANGPIGFSQIPSAEKAATAIKTSID